MSAKIRSISGDEIDQSTGVDASVVNMIKARLAEAERGEIASVGMILVRPNGTISQCWSRGSYRHAILAGTVYLQNELAKD